MDDLAYFGKDGPETKCNRPRRSQVSFLMLILDISDGCESKKDQRRVNEDQMQQVRRYDIPISILLDFCKRDKAVNYR